MYNYSDYVAALNAESIANANAARAQARQAAMAPINQDEERQLTAVDQQEINDQSSANQQQSRLVNQGALAASRRRPGGTTFRRRGSGVSANQLVSGLGVANAKALAEQRRKVVRDSATRQRSLAEQGMSGPTVYSTLPMQGGGFTIYH